MCWRSFERAARLRRLSLSLRRALPHRLPVTPIRGVIPLRPPCPSIRPAPVSARAPCPCPCSSSRPAPTRCEEACAAASPGSETATATDRVRDLPAQGLAAFRDWKRLARARMLWERYHNGGRGPLIDYMDVLAGQDPTYDPLFEGLCANWQRDPARRGPLLDVLAGLGGSFDPATGLYDPEPPPPFRPNGILVSVMATVREQRGGRLTVSDAVAVVRAVAAQSVPLTFEDLASAAPEFSRDTGLPMIWQMAQKPAPKPAPDKTTGSIPPRKPDRGPGW